MQTDEGVKMSKNRWKTMALVTSMFCTLGVSQTWAAEAQTEPVEEESLATMINKYVSLSGTIELETYWAKDFEGVSESGIELATAEIGLEAQVTEWALGTLLVEWDGDEDKINVADAFITLGNTEKFPLTFTGGRFAVPFGVYETNMISDPLTLEIGEAKEDTLMVGFEKAGFSGSFYAFNGETNAGGGDDNIEHFGAALSYSMENDDLSLDVGVGYINSLLDSDGLTDAMGDGMESDYIGGMTVHLIAGFGDFGFIGEYVTGLDDAIEVSEVEVVDGAGDVITTTEETTNHGKPAAWNVEAAYTFAEQDITIAVAFQGTKNLGGILPETRLLSTVGFGLAEGLSLSFQYCHDEDYGTADGGSDASADSVTANLAYEF